MLITFGILNYVACACPLIADCTQHYILLTLLHCPTRHPVPGHIGGNQPKVPPSGECTLIKLERYVVRNEQLC